MLNQAMKRKLDTGECVDLATCKKTPEGHYILDVYTDGKDYCDSRREAWIWSIGRRRTDGVILAATDNTFYQNNDFLCLWLR